MLIIANKHGAVIVNTRTQTALPPVFTDEAAAKAFIAFCPASMPYLKPLTIEALFDEWQEEIGGQGAREAIDSHLAPIGVDNGQKRIGKA